MSYMTSMTSYFPYNLPLQYNSQAYFYDSEKCLFSSLESSFFDTGYGPTVQYQQRYTSTLLYTTVFLVCVVVITFELFYYQNSSNISSVSLSPRLCTRLPGIRSSARLRPRRPSATAFVVYTSALVAPRTVRATIGDRAFPADAASVWNSLPETVRSSPSLPVFCSRLKTELFARLTAELTRKRLTALTTT